MNQVFEQRLGALQARSDASFAGGLRGVEKEALRVTADGYLAQTPHPAGLGSALTNRYITTDFSEALLEFVTPALGSTWETLQVVCDIHQFAYQQLGDELLWCASMPCRIPAEADIPLARYGDSNVGRMKTVYRRGLGHRYGRNMQTISGVHFNYSLPETFWPIYQEILGDDAVDIDFRSTHYLGLVRNFRRYGWIVLYLFGASPALCKSFGGGRTLSMPELNADTYYEPFGTSLRMSDLGYNNQTQASISISLNRLDEYIRDLGDAIRTPEPAYEKIGIIRDGEYQQLSTNKLQIENEYYSPIRPKRVARSGERPTAALRRGGIEYVEIRSLDINVADPAGVNQNTMRFIEAFLIYCLLDESPPFDAASYEETLQNQSLTAKRGREPGLALQRNGKPVGLLDWAGEIVDKVGRGTGQHAVGEVAAGAPRFGLQLFRIRAGRCASTQGLLLVDSSDAAATGAADCEGSARVGSKAARHRGRRRDQLRGIPGALFRLRLTQKGMSSPSRQAALRCSACSRLVRSPGAPFPITRPSASRTGVNSPMVPLVNTSSAV
jgi:glutamate--cysteine ligase